jgi:hypothetical protein
VLCNGSIEAPYEVFSDIRVFHETMQHRVKLGKLLLKFMQGAIIPRGSRANIRCDIENLVSELVQRHKSIEGAWVSVHVPARERRGKRGTRLYWRDLVLALSFMQCLLCIPPSEALRKIELIFELLP